MPPRALLRQKIVTRFTLVCQKTTALSTVKVCKNAIMKQYGRAPQKLNLSHLFWMSSYSRFDTIVLHFNLVLVYREKFHIGFFDKYSENSRTISRSALWSKIFLSDICLTSPNGPSATLWNLGSVPKQVFWHFAVIYWYVLTHSP